MAQEIAIEQHGARRRPPESAQAGQNIQRILAHIERYVGVPEKTYHEIESDLVHLDVHVVRPTGDRNYWTLITSGMSDRPMNVPKGLESLQFAELVICLPKEWKLPADQQDWAGTPEEIYWPVYWLKSLARFPHEFETWLGAGHTVPNGQPPEPYARNTRLCCMLLTEPTIAAGGFAQLEVDAQQTIRFYSVVPLYREEMDLQLKEGPQALREKLKGAGVSEILNIRRRNVARKRWLLF